MAERNYYVLGDDNCKFPAMTKEQILTAISQAVETGKVKDVDTGFVTRLVEQNKGVALYFWVGTQAEYNAIETKADDCFYIITDDTIKEDIEAAIAELTKSVEAIENKVGKVLYTSNAYANEGDTIEFDASKHSLFAITLKMTAGSCVVFCGKSINAAGQVFKISGSNVCFVGSDFTPQFFAISITLGNGNTHTVNVARYGSNADFSGTGRVMIAEIKGIM